MKTTKIAIVLLIICQTVFAQKNKLAVINDPDGYTNIRSGKGTSFEIVDKIYDSEVFHFVDIPNEQWLEVNITKCACDGKSSYSKNIIGYVHRSRILSIESLSKDQLKFQLIKIFDQELEYANIRSAFKERTSIEYKIASNQWAVYHEMMFDEVLTEFSNYICETKDEDLFNLFNNVLVSNSGSSDELPSYTIGVIFCCHPDWTLERIPKTEEYFYRNLGWGFVNSSHMGNKDLQAKMNLFRKSLGLEVVDYENYNY